MFLMAAMRRAGSADVQVKVRNLSPGGMMAESPVNFSRGDLIETELRGIGVVSGKMMGKVQFMMGSVTVKFEGSPAVRLSDPTQHNEGNMVGAVLAPSQSVVMVMS